MSDPRADNLAGSAPPPGPPPTPAPVAFDPQAVYSKPVLAQLLRVSTKTIERMSGIDAGAAQAKAVGGAGTCGTLPPPFYIGRRPYWTGGALMAHFNRTQNQVLRTVGA